MGARQRQSAAVRWAVRLGVLAGSIIGVRKWRDRAVAANTLRFDHVLDPAKPFMGAAAANDQAGSSTPSSASR